MKKSYEVKSFQILLIFSEDDAYDQGSRNWGGQGGHKNLKTFYFIGYFHKIVTTAPITCSGGFKQGFSNCLNFKQFQQNCSNNSNNFKQFFKNLKTTLHRYQLKKIKMATFDEVSSTF